MLTVAENLKKVADTLPPEVTLVAVSKTKPTTAILAAYEAGHRIFGENRVQELCQKYKELPKDIRWHMIGHVQKNKIKYMASFVDLIHGVDAWSTLKEIDKQGKRFRRTLNCLLQVKIAQEEQKFGFGFDEVLSVLQRVHEEGLTHVAIKGLMGMATFSQDVAQIDQEFLKLSEFYQQHQNKYGFTVLSMGMSGDYPIAVANGSNMVRVGSAIFGNRS